MTIIITINGDYNKMNLIVNSDSSVIATSPETDTVNMYSSHDIDNINYTDNNISNTT